MTQYPVLSYNTPQISVTAVDMNNQLKDGK